MMTFALQVEKPQIAGLFLLNTVEEKIPKDLPITVVFNARQPLENDTYARYETGLAHCEHLVSQLRRKINGPYYVPEDESVRSSERGQRGDLTALNLGRDWIRFLTAEHIRNGN